MANLILHPRFRSFKSLIVVVAVMTFVQRSTLAPNRMVRGMVNFAGASSVLKTARSFSMLSTIESLASRRSIATISTKTYCVCCRSGWPTQHLPQSPFGHAFVFCSTGARVKWLSVIRRFTASFGAASAMLPVRRLVADTEKLVRFAPSRADGLPDVREVVVRPDRLDVNTEGEWITFPFCKIGRRQESAVVSFLKRLVGKDPAVKLVGERDWCRPPKDRFFIWYTSPPLKTYMPEDEGRDYGSSYFPRIHRVMWASGRYGTFDLA